MTRTCEAHDQAVAVAVCAACGRWCCGECRVVSGEGLARCPECSVVDAQPHHVEPEPQPEPEPEAPAAFLDPPDDLPAVPWEQPEGSDVVALRRTVWDGLTHPIQYMARMDWRAGDLYTPLVFALLCGTVGHVAGVFQLVFSSEVLSVPGMAGLDGLPAFVVGLMSLPAFPLLFTALLFLSAFLGHLVLDLTGQAKHGFEATFRVVAYAHVGKVLLVVPLLGANVQVFYMVFLVLTGLKAAHGAGLGISMLALLPVVAAELLLG